MHGRESRSRRSGSGGLPSLGGAHVGHDRHAGGGHRRPLYWLTGTGASTSRIYWETGRGATAALKQPPPHFMLPVAYTVFAGEMRAAFRSFR